MLGAQGSRQLTLGAIPLELGGFSATQDQTERVHPKHSSVVSLAVAKVLRDSLIRQNRPADV